MPLYRSAFVEQTYPHLGMGIFLERKNSWGACITVI